MISNKNVNINLRLHTIHVHLVCGGSSERNINTVINMIHFFSLFFLFFFLLLLYRIVLGAAVGKYARQGRISQTEVEHYTTEVHHARSPLAAIGLLANFSCCITTFKISRAPRLSMTSLYSLHPTSNTQLGQPVLHLQEQIRSYPN